MTKTDSATEADRTNAGISHAWRALRHRNFRLFFGGQSISLIGSWMTNLATSWLVYRLTGSALLLGMVSFCGQIPTFLLAPFAGVVIDRLNRRQLLICTQAVSMVQSLLLASLTLSGHITIHWLLALSVVQGIINAIDMPARQSFMIQMIDDREDLSNAIALNSSMVNMARLVGPSLAGILIAATGEGICFLVDGISYIAVIASLVAMRLPPQPPRHAAGSAFSELREGWSYVTGSVPIRSILLLFATSSLMGISFVVLMPIFAAQVLHGGPHTLGFLMAAMGTGSLVSALSLAARRSVRGLIGIIPMATLLFGVGLIGFALSRNFWLSEVTIFFVGMGMMQGMAASNTVIQTLVPEQMRGRVMSYYTVAFVGMAPFGSLIAGIMANRFGAPRTVIFNGAAILLGSLWFLTQLPAVRRAVRPIYEQLGILSPRTDI